MSNDVFGAMRIHEVAEEIISEYQMKQQFSDMSVGSLMLIGHPGLGKTWVVKQAKQQLEKMYNEEFGFMTFIASQSDHTDGKGLPFR